MLRDITLGQYYPVNSIIHRLDPRTKLFFTLIFIISVFSFDSIIGFVIITAFMATFIALCKVPLSFMVRGLRAVMFLVLFAGALNLFFTPGRVVIFQFWKITITYNGLVAFGKMVVRMVYLIVGSSVMTLTTTPSRLTDGLETAFRGLAKIGFPVHEMAMMMSIALRFIPILMEETDKIMKAQMARGADFESGGIIKKAKNMIPLLVPLFVSSFRRAFDLAMAMEARCYRGGAGRTKMEPLKYTMADAIAYAVVIIYIIIVFVVKFLF